MFSQKICWRSSHCLLHVDACFTNIDFCVVSQWFVEAKIRFLWDNYVKNYCSMMIGISPDLEMALYTLCFLTRPNETCPVTYEGVPHPIRTVISQEEELRSAFFVF